MRSLGAHDAKNFDRAGMFAALPHAGGVDEEKLLRRARTEMSTASRVVPGQFAHDGARIVQDRIDERGFSGIRSPDDGDAER